MLTKSSWSSLNIETWKPLPNFSAYECSSLGRIKSKYRIKPSGKVIKGGIMKPWLHRDGRLYVRLIDDSGRRSAGLQLHRLIAIAFHDIPPEGYECDHIDKNKTNNRADNLQWMSPDDHKSKTVEELGKPITLEHVKTNKIYKFISRREASRELGISYNVVLSIANGKKTVNKEYRLV